MKKILILLFLVGCATTSSRTEQYRTQIMMDSKFNDKQISHMLSCWERLKNTYGCEELPKFKETVIACANNHKNRADCWAGCIFGEDESNCK